MIRSHGGIFGRNPAFQNVEVQGELLANGETVTLGINGTKTVPMILYKNPGDNPSPFSQTTEKIPLSIRTPETPNYPTVGSSGLPGNVMVEVFNTTSSSMNFSVLDNGDIGCNNISMTGYLAPVDLYVGGKGWFNTTPNDSLAFGPYFRLWIPTTGDAGDWFVIQDENDNPYVTVDEGGFASFNSGLIGAGIASSSTVTAATEVLCNGIAQGKKTLTTTSTAQNNTTQFPSSYPSCKFLIQARNATTSRYQITELVVTRNATTTVVTATPVNTNTGGVAATYVVDISGSNWRLRITPSVASSTEFTIHYTLIP